MEEAIINTLAIIAGVLFAKFLFNMFSKKNNSKKQTFLQEYQNIINNPEYKVKGNN